MAVSKEIQDRMLKHKKTWADARKTKPGEFSVPKIKDGEYECQVTAKYGISKKGKNAGLFARIEWKIVKGKYKDASSSAYYNLENDNEEYKIATWKSLAGAVQVLTGEDTSTDEYKNDPTLLLGLLDRINKEKPHCMCGLTMGKSEKTGKPYINCWFNSLVDGGDDDDTEDEDDSPKTSSKGGGKKGGKKKAAKDEDDDDEDDDDDSGDDDDDDGEDEEDDDSEDADEDDDDDDDDDEDEAPKSKSKKGGSSAAAGGKKKAAAQDDDDEDDDDDEEDEDDDDPTPEKGDVVKFIPKGQKKAVKCEVMTVNKGAQTVTLKNADTDKQYKACPWDKLKY